MKRLIQAINRLFAEKPPRAHLRTDDVVGIARACMEAKAGQLKEPVRLSLSGEGNRLVWLVRDNAGKRGGDAYLRIDDTTGAVVGYTVPGATQAEAP